MHLRRRTFLGLALGLGLGWAALGQQSSESTQLRFAAALTQFSALFDPEQAKAGAFSATAEVIEATGAPKELLNSPIQISFQAPDRLRFQAKLGDNEFVAGRDGQELWIWQPKKGFGVRGVPGVARFAAHPEELDSTRLAPIALPIAREQLAMAPLLFRTEDTGTEKIDGVDCHGIKASLAPEAQALLKLPSVSLHLLVRSTDQFPTQIGFSDGDKTRVTLRLRKIQKQQPLADSTWKLPATPSASNRIERVALAHMKAFLPAALSVLTTQVPPLGPATGEKKVLASEGRGRLELHDGVRVLFLKGSPEEMGAQHGKLLRKQTRDLVNRVLYGVGVGSSFDKGRWFFGEIESCQARIGKFIEPSNLREMDALASAAGLHPQEVRLANFFPELFHCSGFALWGSATRDGRLYHGRILDYMKGIGLEPNAVVIVHQPDGAIPWANVSYAGFIGSVTAMNAEKISIGEMGGRGEGHWDGKPMAQLIREVMEKSRTLDDAVEIMRRGPRTCEYFYVIADGKSRQAVGIAATPTTFEIVRPGVAHPKLPHAIPDAVLLSAGDRYEELAKRVKNGHGKLDAGASRDLMTRPVCMKSNIHSVLFSPETLEFWVANADSENVASHTRYTRFNLSELLRSNTAAVNGVTNP